MLHTLSGKYSLLDSEIEHDPYSFYKILRTEAPVYWDEKLQVWLVSRYTDVNHLLSDRRIMTVFESISPDDIERKPRRQLWEMLSKTLFYRELSSHSHLRLPLERAFKHHIKVLPARIEEIVNNLLDEVQDRGHIDIASELSEPLPLQIFTELLGVPVEDGVYLKQWGFSLLRFFGSIQTTPQEDEQLLKDMLAITEYFSKLAEQRSQKPKDDLITELIGGAERIEDLNKQEFIVQTGMMLTAGIVVATFPISTGLLALLRNPDQMQKLKQDPTLIGSAIEEILRYESSSQWIVRRAKENIELHDQLIQKDQLVLLGLGSANRDEAQFSNPDQLDINRKDNRHLGFSHGPHSCLGAPLFRMIAPVAINGILHRLGELRLNANIPPEWLHGSSVRRVLKSLPVNFEANSSSATSFSQ